MTCRAIARHRFLPPNSAAACRAVNWRHDTVLPIGSTEPPANWLAAYCPSCSKEASWLGNCTETVPALAGTISAGPQSGTIPPGNTVLGDCPAPFRSAGNPSPPGTVPPTGGTISET